MTASGTLTDVPKDVSEKTSDEQKTVQTLTESSAQHQAHYSVLDDSLRSNSDYQFNINRREITDAKYPTGIAILRDATNAKKLGDPSVNYSQIEKNNTLLRVLGRLRSIDYVVMKQAEKIIGVKNHTQSLNHLSAQLFSKFSELDEKIRALKDLTDAHQHQAELDKLEIEFNTNVLCKALHEANLDEGCYTSTDYEKLLFHYRNLSSLLEPAKTLITVTLDKENNILHRRTEDPVTKKLEKQKKLMRNELSEVIIFPADEQKTFHTMQSKAVQIANQHFASLAEDHTREFAAQLRKKELHTVRNAFLTTMEVIFLNNVEGSEKKQDDYIVKIKAKPQHTRYFIRSGTPVYIGEGESDERVQEATQDNIEQIRQFVKDRLIEEKILPKDNSKKLKIHHVGLVTDGIKTIDTTKQKAMADHMRRATENDAKHPDGLTMASSNAEGLTKSITLSKKVLQELPFPESKVNLGKKIGKKKSRIKQIASILIEHMKQQQTRKAPDSYWIPLVWCASGQDRTGTALELTVQKIIQECCEAENIVLGGELVSLIEEISIGGRHTAVLTSSLIGGSEGCKNDSRATGLFSKASDRALYLKSADTNKKNKVDTTKLKKFIGKSSDIRKMYYDEMLADFINLPSLTVSGEEESQSVKMASLKPLAIQVYGARPADNKINPSDLYLITEALEIVMKLVKGTNAYKNKIRDERCDFERLQNIHNVLKKQAYLKEMSAQLLKFIYAKAKLDLKESLDPASKTQIEMIKIGQEISNNQPRHANKVQVSDVYSVTEGLEIAGDLIKGFDSYTSRYGKTLAMQYYYLDIKKLQIIQEKLIHRFYLKKLTSLFFELIGGALMLGVVATAVLSVMAAPVTGGSSILALSIAVKALAASHAIWFTTAFVGSVVAGGASLFFGNRISNQQTANRSLSQDFHQVKVRAVELGPKIV